MKIATFAVVTRLGSYRRLGVVINHTDATTVVDVNAAYAAMEHARGWHRPQARADAFCPSDLNAYLAVHGTDTSVLAEVSAWSQENLDEPGIEGRSLRYQLSDVTLAAPVQDVPVLRDFAAFEDHLDNTFGRFGLKIPEAWHRRPVAFKGNPTTIVDCDSVIPWPSYTDKLDYELEVAAVVGRDAFSVPVEEAAQHIFGYTLFNDFSARDVQRDEMSVSTGPFKGKDFAWGLGPWIVTPDEVGDLATMALEVRVNGETWAKSTTGAMKWSFEEMISYTSQDERVLAGDVIGSGTVNGGCGFEIDRWIQQGDVVELVSDRIGTLRHHIGQKSHTTLQWRKEGTRDDK